MIHSKLSCCIGKILLLFILNFAISPLVFAVGVKLEDARKQNDKVNIKKVGRDYGILTSEGVKTLQIRVDYAGGDNPVYVGYAEPGANYTHAKWRIIKVEWSGSNPTEIQFADQVSTFTKVWHLRTTYDYEPDN